MSDNKVIPIKSTESVREPSDWREEVLLRFREWLYALTDETAEEMATMSAQPSSMPDLATLLGEMAALRQEVKLQAKTIHGTGKKLENLADDLQDRKPNDRNPGTETMDTLLLELITIRDGVFHAIESTRVFRISEDRLPKRPWLRKPYQGMENMFLSMIRLGRKIDDTLYRLNVHPMVTPGMNFNPETMRAVATSRHTGAGNNTVTGIVRQGYRYNERILQLPEVQVEKNDE